ncbi:reverse transcriptase domain-containing protein [Tanacetum coccineum]|uniref:Reverse transcriptase domain-containing protein n=1 Tax=Tanacetum coccineum TaxID=301880 RepID=A0ABQ5HK58_9ASTR
MAEEDEDKTAFFAGDRVYCYRKMPFGLKNAGATYQRLVDKVFNDQIGKNLKAYVDDMVIKSTPEEDMLVKVITDIEQPKTLKDIQSLNGKLAALSRFLSKGAESSLPFFKVLKSCTGARLMLIDPEGKEYTYALRFKFKTTNNKAEYEALLAGLRISAKGIGIIKLRVIFVRLSLLVISSKANSMRPSKPAL